MRTKAYLLIALLSLGCFTLVWCDKNNDSKEEMTWIANPASVYCEEQGGTLSIESDEEWNQFGLCMFEDGSYCEERSYYRDECQPGELMYNIVPGDVIPEINESENNNFAVDYGMSENYSLDELASAVETIMDTVNNEWGVKVNMKEIKYLWDEKADSELNYCKELNSAIDECVVFSSDFYIPEQDAVMAWAFEPDTTLTNYQWYLGRATGEEWNILTMGY